MHLESKTILLQTVIDFKLQFKEISHVKEIHLPTLGQEEISSMGQA